jgi:hypothetical protein
MSNEIADALRRLADQIDAGASVSEASEVAVVIGNEAGVCAASYIGRKAPARDAGVFLLANGVQRFIVGMSDRGAAPTRADTGTTRGSTH